MGQKRLITTTFLILGLSHCQLQALSKKSTTFFKVQLMPCPFTGPKMFWAGYKYFVPDQKFIYILWQSQTFCA